MGTQEDIYMHFRKRIGPGKALDMFLARWTTIGALRSLGGSISMALFMAYQSRDTDTYRYVIPILDKVISAHISIIGLPLIMSVNAEDIYKNPILHHYYMRFPSYRDNHEEARRLIKEARQIQDEVAGVDAMLEYFGLEELNQLRESLIKHPHHLINLLNAIIHKLIIDRIDQIIRVVSLIHSLLTADDPNLLKHIVTASLARIFNALHDADFAMSCSMILSMHTYCEIFEKMIREDAPRPFLHAGTSKWLVEENPGEWRTVHEFQQPAERVLETTFYGPPFPTNVAFMHEGVSTHEQVIMPWIDPVILQTQIWTRLRPWMGPDISLVSQIETIQHFRIPLPITDMPQICATHDIRIPPDLKLTSTIETEHTIKTSPL